MSGLLMTSHPPKYSTAASDSAMSISMPRKPMASSFAIPSVPHSMVLACVRNLSTSKSSRL